MPELIVKRDICCLVKNQRNIVGQNILKHFDGSFIWRFAQKLVLILMQDFWQFNMAANVILSGVNLLTSEFDNFASNQKCYLNCQYRSKILILGSMSILKVNKTPFQEAKCGRLRCLGPIP